MVTNTKLYINGNDAETTWGLRLDGEQGGYDALLTPPPLKEPVTNKNVTAEGAMVVCGAGLYDERTVSVPVHIVANGYKDFMSKKNTLFSTLKGGALTVSVRRVWSTRVNGRTVSTEETEFTSTMYFVSCSQYTQFSMVQRKTYNPLAETWSDVSGTGYGVAKFVLTLYEPNYNSNQSNQ